MSAESELDASTGFEAALALPVAGRKAIEMAIRAAKIARAKPIEELSGGIHRASTAIGRIDVIV
jgi:hypothetical protein